MTNTIQLFIIIIVNIPSILTIIVALSIRQKHEDISKVLYILAGVYSKIMLGICITINVS
jgi:hypothetical protein